MDRRTNRLSLWTGLLVSMGGLLILLGSLPFLLLVGAFAPMVMLGGLSDAPPRDSGGEVLGAYFSIFLVGLLGGLWHFNLGMIVLVAREHDLVKYLGTFLRVALGVSLAWAVLVGVTSVYVWGKGGLGQIMLIPVAAGLGFSLSIWKLCRRVRRKLAPEVATSPAPKYEWHAGPQR